MKNLQQERDGGNGRWREGDPDIAEALENSEEGLAMHYDDLADMEALERVAGEMDSVRGQTKLVCRHMMKLTAHLDSLTEKMECLDKSFDELRSRMSSRIIPHKSGHMTTNGILDQRRRGRPGVMVSIRANGVEVTG